MRISFKNALIAWSIFAFGVFIAELIHMGAFEALAHKAKKNAEIAEPLYPLIIIVKPVDANIRVMNIRSKYKQAMPLVAGRYDIEVSSEGYKTQRRWVELKENHVEHHFLLETK